MSQGDKYFLQAMKCIPSNKVRILEIGDSRYERLCREKFPFSEYMQVDWNSYKDQIWKSHVVVLTNLPSLAWEALGYAIDHMLDYIIMPEVHFADRSFNNDGTFYWGKGELTDFIKLRAHLVKEINWSDKNTATLVIRNWKSYEY